MEYFTKWVEAMPLHKATEGAIANFIKENIIVRFGVPRRIICDNGTPFVNSDARKMLEFYQVKHHRSSSQAPSFITLLPSRKWAGKGDKQDPHKDHQQNELRIYRRMGNAPTKCFLGL